jgi:bifunctional non-homologous end joining protein LigD
MCFLERLIGGTIDFVFENVVTTAIGFVAGRWTAKAIESGRLKKTTGSNFATKRILEKRKADPPLWQRAIHVPEEEGLMPLEDMGPKREIEYVIQEHEADRAGRHFDLRLVLNGKSASWAIPMKGKRGGLARMPEPGERWAAIRQPDHLVEYNKFEGEIPKGQLGAGQVKIWARGKADIHKIEDGHVHFEIFSGPAKGRYVIVQTNGTQGLILSKKPEPAEPWTKPQYTKKAPEVLDALEGQAGLTAERKVDGASVEMRIEDGRVRVLSHRVSKRSGQLVEHTARLPHLDDLRTEGLDGTAVRAEAWHPRGVNFLSGTLNSNVEKARATQRTAGPVRLGVFDIVKYKGRDVRGLPYAERRAIYEKVAEQLGSKHVEPVRSVKSGFANFYEQQVALKHTPTDGVVVKDGSQPYDAKPLVKVKPSDLADCEVVKLTEGKGKHAGRLGALTVKVPDNGKNIQVGTGFSDWERQWIWDHRDEMPGEVARVDFHVRHGKRTETGPRFDSWHPDKSETALKMYAEAMDPGDPKALFRLKSAAGWRRTA